MFQKLSEVFQENILGGIILVCDRYSEHSVVISLKGL